MLQVPSYHDVHARVGGYLVEKWVWGCAAEKGSNFTLFGILMGSKITQNWFREGVNFQNVVKNLEN